MLRKIQFEFGAGPGLRRLRCKPGAVTVFVGPNNAGKSRALREIAEALGVKTPEERPKLRGMQDFFYKAPAFKQFILRDVELSLPRDKQLRAAFIKAVTKDIKTLGDQLKAMNSIRNAPNEEHLEFFVSLPLGLHLKDLLSKGKLNTRKFKLSTQEPTPAEEQFTAGLIRDLTKHAQSGRYRKLVVQWILKRYVHLAPYREILTPHTIVLDGTTRLSLVNDTQATDWREKDGNLLANLLKNRDRLERLRSIVQGAIKYYPVIDTTHPEATKLKLSKEHPGDRERSTTNKALQYFDEARSIGSFSDGMRSFVGILSAVLSEDYKIILIDEPEAFLHPPLARKLGVELHTLAWENHAQVFAATHSPDFLMGCIQSGTDVNIVRLTFKEQQATARELKPEQVRDIMRHPLLRSTGVLGALFHEGAVVCESDSDRAFYQELNERLLAEGRGAQAVAFLNAQNKQTIDRIIKPLRRMGIPAAAVLDIDVLSPGEDLSRLLMAADVAPTTRAALTSARDRFFKRCMELCEENSEKAKKELKQKGLQLLPKKDQAEFRTILFDPLEKMGIFVVPTGELESWLPEVSQEMGRSEKSKWLVKMFERLGDDPSHPEYIKPGQQGVWSFLDSIAQWIAQPVLGIPDNA